MWRLAACAAAAAAVLRGATGTSRGLLRAGRGPPEEQAFRGKTVLCHRGSLWVVLDGDLNLRTMVFGTSPDGSLQQSMARCRGPAPDSCFAKDADACDLSSARCPCDFHMAHLPMMDVEYQYIAERLAATAAAPVPGGAPSLPESLAAAIDAANSSAPATPAPDTNPDEGRVLMVGLGGGMLPQYMLEHNDDLAFDAVEVDRDVYNAARSFFGVAAAEASGRLRVTVADGTDALEGSRGGYQAIVVDCFANSRVAEPCRNKRFAKALFSAVRPGGEVMQNVLTNDPNDTELDKDIKGDLQGLLDAYHDAFGVDAVSVQSRSTHRANAVVVAKRA